MIVLISYLFHYLLSCNNLKHVDQNVVHSFVLFGVLFSGHSYLVPSHSKSVHIESRHFSFKHFLLSVQLNEK